MLKHCYSIVAKIILTIFAKTIQMTLNSITILMPMDYV